MSKAFLIVLGLSLLGSAPVWAEDDSEEGYVNRERQGDSTAAPPAVMPSQDGSDDYNDSPSRSNSAIDASEVMPGSQTEDSDY